MDGGWLDARGWVQSTYLPTYVAGDDVIGLEDS